MNNGKIPVSTAKFVARKHGLTQCLLIGWDGEFVHVETYGKTPADCVAAAKAQDFWTGRIRDFSFRGEITTQQAGEGRPEPNPADPNDPWRIVRRQDLLLAEQQAEIDRLTVLVHRKSERG